MNISPFTLSDRHCYTVFDAIMSRRENESDFEGPPSKMRKEDLDDGGASGRSGRVRKKSAKVLEMEEFEQVEKNQHVTKKGKTPKPGGKSLGEEQEFPGGSTKKLKTPKIPEQANLQTQLDVTPVSSKVGKVGTSKSELTAQLSKPVQQFVQVQTSGILAPGITGGVTLTPTELLAATIKQEYENETPSSSELTPQPQIVQQASSPIKSEDQKSVIKYLLSSPSSGTKPSVNTNVLSKIGTLSTPQVDSTGQTVKKSAKKLKSQEKSVGKGKPKEKKVKEEPVSPPSAMDVLGLDSTGAGLKMKIMSSSDPSTAQVTLNPQASQATAVKPKKPRKNKQQVDIDTDMLLDSSDIFGLSDDVDSPPAKKPAKKVSKKKEKLIRDAISAAQQMPNLAALVASQSSFISQDLGSQVITTTPTQKPQKSQKKKAKAAQSHSVSDDLGEHQMKTELAFGDDGEETHLVIAETEKKKKKSVSKKKTPTLKEKVSSGSPKGEKEKKLPKRAPTAYMLFCNTHRPTIVNENPGIEFAGISRKLGEMWQTLSNKQKLQWRRKAQRRRKKGSNLISTGKTGKETAAATLTPASTGQAQISSGVKLSTLMQKAQRSTADDTPQSPTKNFSIEPIDVAAHLKLLGESLSIIGMRLQEHKGMIAVQGSLSVLLDSLLCACGPLLCLTQQVPGMDGCSPFVHAQTLDSVAYVMPGL